MKTFLLILMLVCFPCVGLAQTTSVPAQAIIVNKQTGTTYTVLNVDRARLVTLTNGSAVAVTLPRFSNGWYVWVENRGVGTVTITPSSGTIDGAGTLALATNQGVLLATDGTNYFTGARGKEVAGGTVTSVTGTTNQIDVATGTTTPVVSLSSTLVAPGTVTATTNIASPFYKSTAADPADAGAVRLGNNEFVEWEKATTGTDWTLGVNSSDILQTNAAFRALTITDDGLTAGRVPYAGTGGLLSDDSGFTYNSGTHALTTTTFIGALTGNASTASNLSGTPALPNGTTATTQSQADNSTKLATTAYADTLGATKQGTLTNSAGLRAALSDELGTGSSLFDGATPTSFILTNATGLPLSTGVTGTLAAAQEPAHTGDVTNSAGSLALSIAANAVTLAKLATQATNTVLGNATSGTAVPTALAVGTCSTSGSALIWTTNTGFGCNTSIAANTATTATTATNATNTAVTDDTTTNATMYLTWVTTTTGNLPQKISSSKLTFNPSTGGLVSTLFNGLTITNNGTNTLNIAAGQTLTVTTGGTLASAAYKATGTSGNTVPLLDGANTWTTTQTFAHATTTSGIIGGTTGGADFNFQNTGETLPQSISIGWTAGASNQAAKAATIFSTTSGVIGFGTTGTTANGSIAALAFTFSGATQTLSNAAFTTCTAITSTANVLGCTASDRNLKQDFRVVTGGLAFIRSVQPESYSFKQGTPWYDGGRTRVGLVAQDVREALPEAVFPIGPGQPLQIDYNAVTAKMLGAMKELDAKVTTLEKGQRRHRR